MKTFQLGALSLSAACLALAACGGGGDDDNDDEPGAPVGPGWTAPPPPSPLPPAGATADGIFRDAVVEGLDYSDGGALSGATGANGRFQYAQGNTVTFRIGGVTLGSLAGQPYMTPMHLIGAGTPSVAIAINNRLRLLQMLDLDNNPENGIVISNAVRAVATAWPTPDFNASYTAFASAIEPIRQAASVADGVTHVLPSDTQAAAHFARNAWCTYNGLYRGTFSGSGDNGVWALVVYGNGGLMFGGGYSNVDRAGFELQKQTASGLSIFPAFTATLSGGSFSGRFDTPDFITGTWSNPPDTGVFSGSRSGGSGTAVYRISGYQFPLGTALLMSFEINAANQVTGQIIDRDYLRTAVPVELTGTLNGTTLTAAAAGNTYTINGTFNTAAAPGSLQLTGTLRDNVKSRDVSLSLPGCRLN